MDELDLGSTIKGFIAGQKVFGRYTLQRMLGRGGMGVVWLAKDESLEREVALKFLPEVVAADPRAVDDLKRETRRSLKLTHPHIVRIYDFIEDARMAAIAMEFIAGETLAKRALAQPERIFSPKELQPWVEQLCSALDYAHGKAQVVHRDLKPANLMLDERGDLKIADFGIAASVSDSVSRVSAQAGSSGTPVYMSPQQMMGEKPAITDDVYAIGATLYELLTGKPPFHSGNVFLQVQSKVPPSIAARREELGVSGEPVPPHWEEAIAACLAKEPKNRPQSAGEVAARLGRVGVASTGTGAQRPKSSGGSGAVLAPGLPPPAGRREKLRPGLLLAGVVTIMVAGWYFGVHQPGERRLELERSQRTAREDRDRAVVQARIDALLPGTPVEVYNQVNSTVRAYLETAPALYRQEISSAWQRQSSAWEAAGQPPESGRRWIIPHLGLEMLPIAAGTFEMRSSIVDPVTRVTLSRPFWLGKTEVTQVQWEAVMGSNPSRHKGGDRPVEQVSWNEAVEFCRKLTQRERAAGRLPHGYEYTLPTEAQWEYACRAGTTGIHAGLLDSMGWYGENSGGETKAVGQKQPNAWGLHDMHGNVWEWCADWYGKYPGGSVTDPTGISSGSDRVYRGGSVNSSASDCSSANRLRYTPDGRWYLLGFRLALTATSG